MAIEKAGCILAFAANNTAEKEVEMVIPLWLTVWFYARHALVTVSPGVEHLSA